MSAQPDKTLGGAVTTAATTFAPNIATAADGSYVFLWVAWGTASATFSQTGWTQLGVINTASTITGALFYKVKAAGNTTTTFTTQSGKGSWGWASYTGLDPTTPYDFIDVATNMLAKAATSVNVSTPSVTAATALKWALAFFASRSSTSGNAAITFTPDAALTERLDQNNQAAASGIWTGVEIADSNGPVTAAAHSYTAVASFSEQYGAGALMYLNPHADPQVTVFETANWTSTAATQTITVTGAAVGDKILVVFGGDGFNNAPTAASVSTTAGPGTTGSWTEPIERLNSANQGWQSSSAADVTGAGNITVTLSRTQSTGQVWGGYAVLIKNSGGIGNTAFLANGTADSTNLTVSAGSHVFMLGVEWDHVAVVQCVPAGAIDIERNAALTAVTWYANYWVSQAAGTRAYGMNTNASSANYSMIAIEVLAAGGTPSLPPRRARQVTHRLSPRSARYGR
jgi:hypothetical protein